METISPAAEPLTKERLLNLLPRSRAGVPKAGEVGKGIVRCLKSYAYNQYELGLFKATIDLLIERYGHSGTFVEKKYRPETVYR